MHKDLNRLLEELNITFRDRKLLQEAFTHSSYLHEHKNARISHNERLEFLGDAVLELTVSEYLFRSFKKRSEGDLTKLRASIVCEASLNKFANSLRFGDYIWMGKGEEATGGRQKPALLADVYEAFIGALYLDQGLQQVQSFLQKHMFPLLEEEEILHFQVDDYKSQLQVLTQQQSLGKLEYRIVDELGPSHDREFISEVYLDQVSYGSGKGRSKKEAEQKAAQQALMQLSKSQSAKK